MKLGRAVLVLFSAATLLGFLQTLSAQEVTIPAVGAGMNLSGILHKPAGKGPFPAVVMLVGCDGCAEGTVDHHASYQRT